MTKRKSIVSSFGEFSSTETSQQSQQVEEKNHTKKASRVPAGIIGATDRTLTEIREERDALLEQAENGTQIITLDHSVIDPSPFRDRLPDDNDADFESFKNSIAQEGQKVPITVRRHNDQPDRYQIVYGHRRWRALRELSHRISAIIVNYSDRDLVVAQGIENANRQDLSWIERALFADEMQSAGIKPRDIKGALSIDDAELSKFRSVLKIIPKELVELIGRAPNIGRPRWLELAKAIKYEADLARVRKTLSDDKVLAASSDRRFLQVLGQFGAQETKEPKSQTALELGGLGTMTITPKALMITLADEHKESFAIFLEDEMKALVERYKSKLEKS